MKLLSTKSAIRYLLPNGTAGLLRSVVSGKSRSPLPPARMRPRMRGSVTRSPGVGPLRRRLEVSGQVREAEVLRFFGLEVLFVLPRRRPAARHPSGQVQETGQVGGVLGEPRLRVVAGGPCGDEELPVRGFSQEQGPPHLLDDPAQPGRAPPPAGGDEGPEVVLGLVDLFPRPFGVLVHPDAVVSSLAPGSLEERDRLTLLEGSWGEGGDHRV